MHESARLEDQPTCNRFAVPVPYRPQHLLCCSDVCVEAKLACGHERTLQLCHTMMAATKEDTVSLNDFLRVINNFTDICM